MARSRNIKPGFFRNEVLAEMDFGTRLLFIGLWTLADKAGRLEDRPKKIKIEVFPADDVDVPSMLHALAMHGFITRYAVDSVRYIQINNFLKHQSPHHKEVESVIPGTESADPEQEKNSDKTTANPCTTQAQPMHELSMGQASPEKSTSSPLIPDSGFLIPDTGIKTCASGDAPPSESGPAQELYSEDFNAFWSAYPSKKGKKPAAQKFKSLRKAYPSQEFLQMLLDDLAKRSACHDWVKEQGKFVPMASTYLAQERWNDPIPTSNLVDGTSRFTGRQSVDEHNLEVARRWAAGGDCYDQE